MNIPPPTSQQRTIRAKIATMTPMTISILVITSSKSNIMLTVLWLNVATICCRITERTIDNALFHQFVIISTTNAPIKPFCLILFLKLFESILVYFIGDRYDVFSFSHYSHRPLVLPNCKTPLCLPDTMLFCTCNPLLKNRFQVCGNKCNLYTGQAFVSVLHTVENTYLLFLSRICIQPLTHSLSEALYFVIITAPAHSLFPPSACMTMSSNWSHAHPSGSCMPSDL